MGEQVLKYRILGGCALSALASPAWAQSVAVTGDPATAVALGAVSLAVATGLWALRVSLAERRASRRWAARLAKLEAQFEKSESVLSAQPGLVIVWDESDEEARDGWGKPRALGGPAALAALLSFIKDTPRAERKKDKRDAVSRLLDAIGDMQIEDARGQTRLRDKIQALRTDGAQFSASVVTSAGRVIEVDGRVAGALVCLWLIDPQARAIDDTAPLCRLHERDEDLHASYSLLDRAPFPAWRRDANLKLTWVNAAYARAVDAASPIEVVEKGIELDAAAAAVARRAAAERAPVCERKKAVIHGERRALEIVETPLHGAGGAAMGGIAFDATEGEEASQALKRHIAAHSETLNHISSAVAIFGAGKELIYFNRAFAQMWSLSEAQLVAKPQHGEILDLLRDREFLPEHPDYAEWKAAQLALYDDPDGENAGDPETGGAPDEVWNLPDGRAIRVARQRHPFGGVLLIADDITDELRLKARYNTQIGVQRATLNNLAEGVAVFGADGRLQLYNSAFQRMWSLPADLLGQRPHFDQLQKRMDASVEDGGDHWPQISERITSLSPDHRRPLADQSLTRRDGKAFVYSAEPLPDGATLLRFLDVTDSRMRERALQERNEALQAADAMKSSFVNHVSYQLRTPLNTIIGFTELLDSEMFGELNERQKEYTQGVLKASNDLLSLINNIIDLATIEAGRMELDRGTVDIAALVDDAVALAGVKADETQVSIDVECGEDVGAIEADERRLKQAVYNLLVNAISYTSAGGRISVGAARNGEEIRLWVADTGRGIAAEDQARAFERFESRGQGAGAGLGLAIVREFVELHGGWVALQSEPDKGTIVICHLPARAAEQAQPADAAAGDAPAEDFARLKSQPAAE